MLDTVVHMYVTLSCVVLHPKKPAIDLSSDDGGEREEEVVELLQPHPGH